MIFISTGSKMLCLYSFYRSSFPGKPKRISERERTEAKTWLLKRRETRSDGEVRGIESERRDEDEKP